MHPSESKADNHLKLTVEKIGVNGLNSGGSARGCRISS